jgi:3-hydroxy-3-methylglutaryl CoA synthase
VKHACYGGTAALVMAASWLASGMARGKALVITTDESRMHLGRPYEFVMGAGAAAMLVSDRPRLLELELGAAGYHTNEVSDLTRPTARVETGNSETSLLSYLDGLDGAYAHYVERAGTPVDFDTHFQKMIYHTPFGGITFLAHKELLRQSVSLTNQEAWRHFADRSLPALRYLRRMGGTYSSSTFVGMLGLVDTAADLAPGDRVGVYSYGSGSCAELYSVLIGQQAREVAAEAGLGGLLDQRYPLSVPEYEAVERARTARIDDGDHETSTAGFGDWYDRHYRGQGYLVFRGTREHYRQYGWS